MKQLNKICLIGLALLISSCSNPSTNMDIQPLNSAVKVNNVKPKFLGTLKIPANLNPETKKVTDAIVKVSKGVELISESEYEFSVTVWQNQSSAKLTAPKLLEALKLNKKLKCEEQKETINGLLGDYATKKYWQDSGYDANEITEKIAKYKAFIKESSVLKNVQVFYVDDVRSTEDPDYDGSNDFSGQVGVYVLGRVGSDIVVLNSFYVWT